MGSCVHLWVPRKYEVLALEWGWMKEKRKNPEAPRVQKEGFIQLKKRA